MTKFRIAVRVESNASPCYSRVMTVEPRRPDPDALMAAATREARSSLKIFLGAAPGVGKTFEMLAQAARRRQDGVDVVAGIIETHGRRETEQQIGSLPVLPRRPITYTGPNGTQTLDEFDLDAALARRPALLLVDELAHTNVPGSRHGKRWEDVAELLAAGIPVWATLNVQHLESLNDAVTRITGIRVTETLPDSVLELADEIELIDLPPKELRARLREGRIYRPDLATRALEGFFREGNLAALREIALRRAAQHVDANVLDYMQLNAIAGPWPAGERVLALIGPSSGEAVVRHAKQLADALHAPLLVLHVEVPAASDGSTTAALALASDLGAVIESRAATDVVAGTLELARARNVTQIVIGRSAARGGRWRRATGRGLAVTLLRRAPEFALHVVPAADPKPSRSPRRRAGPGYRRWLAWIVPGLLVALVVLLGEAASGWLDHETLGMLFLAVTVASATLYGLTAALLSALLGFLCWNFFFIPPLYQLTVREPRDVIAILVFAGVAVSTGLIASRLHDAARSAQSRIEGLRQVGAFSRALGSPTTEVALYEEIVRHAAPIAGAAILLTGGEDTLDIRAAEPHADTLDEGSWAAAHWAYRRGEVTGSFTTTLPSSPWRFLPIRIARREGAAHLLGLLGVRTMPGEGAVRAERLPEPALQALEALADQAAVALERVHLANAAARDVAMIETQKLRTALLNSLGHDLRTPLTGIRGSAETLRTAWTALTVETRSDLLAAIEDDTARMTRFLDNITDMTRLDSGEIVPMLAAVDVGEIVQDAYARLHQAADLDNDVPADLPAVMADPALLEQIIFNILDNAAKYARGRPRIHVHAELLDGRVRIAIADGGIGITAEDLPHVFDSFYRAHHGDRVAAGTGLGLAIARGLIEAMGGSVTATSPRPDLLPGEAPGTVVTLELPAAIAPARVTSA